MIEMTGKRSILLLGAGGHARACIDVIEQHGQYVIAGLVGVEAERGRAVLGYPILGVDSDLAQLLPLQHAGVVVVGQIESPEPRQRLYEVLERHDSTVPAIVSPHAYVSSHAQVGAGTLVMHGAVINAGARVGKNCIVNTMALIEHDTVVGDHCHVATGARLNSSIRIGDSSFVGSGAAIKQGVSIGRFCVIGMGLAVRKDCPDHTVLYV